MVRVVGSFELVSPSFQLLSAEHYITKGLCHLITWPWGDGTVGGDAASVTLFTSLHPLVSVWEEYLPQMLPKLHHCSYFHLDDCLNPRLKLYHRWLHHHNVSLHASSYCLQPKQKMFLLFLDFLKIILCRSELQNETTQISRWLVNVEPSKGAAVITRKVHRPLPSKYR